MTEEHQEIDDETASRLAEELAAMAEAPIDIDDETASRLAEELAALADEPEEHSDSNTNAPSNAKLKALNQRISVTKEKLQKGINAQGQNLNRKIIETRRNWIRLIRTWSIDSSRHADQILNIRKGVSKILGFI